MEALFSDYEAVRKSGLFDPEYYLATYADVAERNVDPLVHYLEEGAQEGRNPHRDFDGAFYLEQCRARGEEPANPLLHYLRIGAARGFKTRRDGSGGGRAAQPGGNQSLGKAPILVAIEAMGAVGAAEGRSRLSVSGWALAASPITEITVLLDGAVLGTATYGLPRPDVEKLYPDRPGAAQCGFILAFDLPVAKGGGVFEPVLKVATMDGEGGQRPLRFEIPPQDIGPGVFDPLDNRPEPPEAARAPIQLRIDSAALDRNGILRVEGWVVSRVRIDAVEVSIDGNPIGNAEFGRVREDVEKIHPDYPNARFAGFLLIADVGKQPPGRRGIRVCARTPSGVSGEATTQIDIPASIRRVRPSDPGFEWHREELSLSLRGRLVLRGWIVCAAPVERIVLRLDEQEIGDAEPGLPRPDIGNLFPGLPHARQSGFLFEGDTAAVAAGKHRIVLRALRTDGRTEEAAFTVVAGDTRRPAAPAVGDEDRKLQIDAPFLLDGSVETPIRGNLQIGGWALARDGVEAIEIALDGTPIATADYGLRRLDIKAAFPDWPDALASGFSALLPHRLLPKGSHTVTVTLRDKGGNAAENEFRIEVEELPDASGPWSLRRKLPQAEVDLCQRLLDAAGHRPLIVAMLPVGGDGDALRRAERTIDALCAQIYADWRLVIVAEKGGERLLKRAGGRAELARAMMPRRLAEIALSAGVPDEDVLFTLLTPGDELGCDAFLEAALAAARNAEADFFYSDERCLNPGSGVVEAFFKPQWSPDLLLSKNYIGRLWFARAGLLAAAAAPQDALLANGEYDLVLRCTEHAISIRHIPAVLCERSEMLDDPAQSRRALEQALARRGIAGTVRAGLVRGTHRVSRKVARPGLVSIIIPTCAADGMIKTCLDTLRAVTAYRAYEIVCIENIPAKDRKWRGWLRRNADRVVATTDPFNWARFNNLAAREAKGEFLLFLNDDIEITEPGWLDALVEEVQRPEVGVVGARLLYPDRRIQHAGMFLATPGQARHAFRYAGENDPGYFGMALTRRNVIAVTGACMMTRRDTFAALGGFDETQSIVNNDLDYCLRAWQSGLLNVYTPFASLVHYEQVSRAALDDEYDQAVFDGKWRDLFLAGDPFYSPHLSKKQDDYAIDHEPTRLLVTGSPVLSRDDIRKILVVKLDHIGDCVTSFPAVRRLKRHFPEAHIAVLTSRASRPVWALEPSVEATIEFDFFHARSGLGELERTEEDWRKLRERLVPERFDLAVDLRKHTETRPVLQHTGARYLAGFDFRDRFPWLDIALEWGVDQIYARKRQHVVDDLVNLADTIAAACESDRTVIATRPAPAAALAELARSGKPGPLVCVHPTVGNDARQWPIEYFAAVIDRLIEQDGARIVLIGGPGDEDVAAEIAGHLRHPKAVTSLAGKVPLAELPGLLAGMSLFLGNNSGPKHIAAGLGVPTVGVHSGTEDVREWGPVGPSAVAVAREVVCAPCYLATAADCRRGLACLRELEPARVYEACKRLLPLGAPVQVAASPSNPRARSAGRKRPVQPVAASTRASAQAD